MYHKRNQEHLSKWRFSKNCGCHNFFCYIQENTKENMPFWPSDYMAIWPKYGHMAIWPFGIWPKWPKIALTGVSWNSNPQFLENLHFERCSWFHLWYITIKQPKLSYYRTNSKNLYLVAHPTTIAPLRSTKMAEHQHCTRAMWLYSYQVQWTDMQGVNCLI